MKALPASAQHHQRPNPLVLRPLAPLAVEARALSAARVSRRTGSNSELDLGFAHAFAEIRHSAPSKPPELRHLCLRLELRLSGFDLRQPEAQLGALVGFRERVAGGGGGKPALRADNTV